MDSLARGFWAGNGDAPVTKERALAVLDAGAEQWRGADAEFDDHLMPDEPLGRLLMIAFGPWTPEDEAENDRTEGEHFYEKIRDPFSKRYEFC
jgi:hypothetical protein